MRGFLYLSSFLLRHLFFLKYSPQGTFGVQHALSAQSLCGALWSSYCGACDLVLFGFTSAATGEASSTGRRWVSTS